MGLDRTFVNAMAKLDDGFALADRIVAAARGGTERDELTDMIETAGDDADLAVAVISRLVTHVIGESPEQMAKRAQHAGIPPILETTGRQKISGGVVL